MDSLLSKINDVEFALSKIKYSYLYDGGLALFQALNFPVTPSEIAVNSDINQFIYFKLVNRVQFSVDELNYLKKISSISVLFIVDAESVEERKFRKANSYFEKILFLAINLNSSKSDRSQDVYSITKILNKAYSHPVFMLFYHEGLILFSAMVYETIGHEQSGKVFLSDWYCCSETDYKVILKLSQLSFENHGMNSIEELFVDMIFSISREYYIYPKSYDYLTFGCFERNENYSLLDDVLSVNSIKELTKENHLYYSYLYGDDFVDEDETIEVLLPEDDEWLLEGLDGFIHDDAEFDDEIGGSSENDEYSLPEDFNEEYFDDPIKLLEWLDGKN
ncbi:MAG: hypothetical protein ACYDG6_05335 [Thermincolia bacterium]